MSSNLGSIFYSSVQILPSYDVAASGPGNLSVAGNTLLAGAATSVQGTLGVVGAATLGSTLNVSGTSTFAAPSTFNSSVTFTGPTIFSNVTDATNSNTGSLQ